MTKELTIACLQYSSTKNELITLKKIKKLIDEAIEVKAELIALPECATSLQKNSSLTIIFQFLDLAPSSF